MHKDKNEINHYLQLLLNTYPKRDECSQKN